MRRPVLEQKNPRKLDAADYRLMGLPAVATRGKFSMIAESVQDVVARYLKQRDVFACAGKGFFVSGPAGSGKTSLLGVCLKSLNRWGYSAFYVTVRDLREDGRAARSPEVETPLIQLCRKVDILAIDNISETELDDRFFGTSYIQALIKQRCDWLQPTLLATSIDLNSAPPTIEPLLNFWNYLAPLKLPPRMQDLGWWETLLGDEITK